MLWMSSFHHNNYCHDGAVLCTMLRYYSGCYSYYHDEIVIRQQWTSQWAMDVLWMDVWRGAYRAHLTGDRVGRWLWPLRGHVRSDSFMKDNYRQVSPSRVLSSGPALHLLCLLASRPCPARRPRSVYANEAHAARLHVCVFGQFSWVLPLGLFAWVMFYYSWKTIRLTATQLRYICLKIIFIIFI